MSRTILITGATGQIGSTLTKALLKRGEHVRVLVRNKDNAERLFGEKAELAHGDLLDKEALGRAVSGVDAVVHLAGISSYWRRQAHRMWSVNVLGTAHLLDACAAAQVMTFLYTSSIATLGWLPDGEIGDETTQYNWHHFNIAYFDTKYEAEQMVLSDPRINTIVVNPGLVFGSGDTACNGLRFLMEIKAGVPGYPPGATTAAVLDDVVNGHILALDKGKAGEKYILGGSPIEFGELFSKIAQVVGSSPPNRLLKPWMIGAISLSNTLTTTLTGREPRISLSARHILTRNRRYHSTKAIETIGYQISPLTKGLHSCWNWHRNHNKG